jgi:hypothetical protein
MLTTRHKLVFSSLVISMIIGAVCLKLSSSTVSAAGAFSLSEYYAQNSVEKAISSFQTDSGVNWCRIETCKIFVDKSGFSQECHFIIGDGIIGSNGQVIPTDLWREQLINKVGNSDEPVIWIGLVIDEVSSHCNQLQTKRAELLADCLARKYQIPNTSIAVPFL